MTDTRHRTTAGTWLRFVARLVGLVGVGLAAVGGVMAWVESSRPAPSFAPFGYALLAAGGVLVGLWLTAEVGGGLMRAAGAKSAQGGFTLLLGALAVAAVVVVNLVSARFYARLDCTRDTRFTLDRPLVDDLKTLDPATRTTVVVLQLDKTSPYDPDKPDALTAAAQTKITEKVLDLIDDLRQHPELSARFDVRVLRGTDERFEEQLTAAAKEHPGLKAAVEGARESSVFFAANGRVRRMPFAQFYLLDKTASRGKASVGANPTAPPNLVLAPQGKERFVRALVGLERKAPKVGLLTVHPWLTSRPLEDDSGAAFTSSGLRAALERNGCEVTDVVLRKVEGNRLLGPSADTLTESRLDEVVYEYRAAEGSVRDAADGQREWEAVRTFVREAPLADLRRRFREIAPQGSFTETEYREKLQSRLIDPQIAQLKADADEAGKRAAKLKPQYDALLDDDKVQADQREADVKAKLAAVAADCDLLVIPRLTSMNMVKEGMANSPRLFMLARVQVAVVKDFLAAGKPVLFALGPPVTGRTPPDAVEKLVERLGIELGTQTVLTTAEAEAMKKPETFGNRSVNLPPLEVAVWSADPLAALAGGGVFANPNELDGLKRSSPINAVAAAFDRANRTVDGTLELKRSGYRPLYLAPRDHPFAAPAAVLFTTADAWNESRPLFVGKREADPTSPEPPPPSYYPKVDTPRPDDPRTGTREQEKKGRFVVGVAAEVPVPAEWTDPQAAAVQAAAVTAGAADIGFGPGVTAAMLTPDRFRPAGSPKTVRVAVYGHGGFFVGKQLDPGQEALLMSTANWLMARDDSLPKDVPDADTWRFPRVPLTDREKEYWQAGAVVGLPLAAALLGVIAVMLRRLR